MNDAINVEKKSSVNQEKKSTSFNLRCPKCDDIDVGFINHRVKGEKGLIRLYYCRICGYSEWFYSIKDDKNRYIHSHQWIQDLKQNDIMSESDKLTELFEDDPTMKMMEKRYILYLLKKHDGNKSKVARILNISRSTLREKLNTYKE